MKNRFAYFLIIIGALWFIYSLGLIDLSFFSDIKVFAVSLIVVGIVELLIHFIDLGELGVVLKSTVGILFFFIILLRKLLLITLT